MDQPSSWPSSAVCPVCERTFARREHLTRHMRIHTREKPFSCSTCGKEFSRLDVLNRHQTSHHPLDAALDMPQVSSRACEQCAAGRVRCSRQQPCRRCSDRKLVCQYPPRRKQRSHATADAETPDGTPDRTQEEAGYSDHATAQNLLDLRGGEPAAAIDELDNDVNPRSTVPVSSQLADRPLESQQAAWMGRLQDVPLDTQPADLYDFAQPALGLSGINWMSPEAYPDAADWGTQLAGFLRQRDNAHVDASFPFFFGPEADNQAGVGLYSNSSGDAGANTVTPAGQTFQGQPSSTSSLSPAGSKHSLSTEGRLYVDGSGARAPFGGKSKHRYSIANIDLLDHGDSVEYPASSAADQLIPIPSYDFMVQGIREECHLQQLRFDLVSLLSRSQAQFFARQYFDNFHPSFPFLRQSSFSHDISQNWTLLLAVCAVGSRYTRRLHGQEPSDSLLDLLRKILRRQMYGLENSQDPSVPFVPGNLSMALQTTNTRVQTLQAGILAVMCMLHSGRKAYMDSAFIDRHYLVEACNKLGLLSQKARTGAITPETTVRADATGVWARRESEIRTGMMIWLLDSTIHYEFDQKPLMSLSDVQCPIPVHEDVWEKSSHMPPTEGNTTSVTFREAMDMLYIEKRLPSAIGEFSIEIMIHGILRKTKEVIAWEQMQINSWTPRASPQPRPKASSEECWLPDTPTMSRWRNSACDCLDVLHWLANGKAAMLSGAEHHSILLLHLARLVALIPSTHIQTLATASSRHDVSSQGAVKHGTAREQVLRWVMRDQYKARLCVIHCGAIFWHVRRYSCDSILEPYAIYISTLVLWAFSVSTQFVGQGAIQGYANCRTPGTGVTADTEDPSVPSFFHLDRPMDDELVQVYVRVGYNMAAFIMNVGDIQSPGAPGKILQEGIRLLERGPQGDEHAHARRSDPPQGGKCYTWGIEGPYIELLRQMVQASERQAEGLAATQS